MTELTYRKLFFYTILFLASTTLLIVVIIHISFEVIDGGMSVFTAYRVGELLPLSFASQLSFKKLIGRIEKAYHHGVIREGNGLLGKLEQCRKRCYELEQENENFRRLNLKTMNDYKSLEGRYMELKLQKVSNRDRINNQSHVEDDGGDK